MIAKKCTRENRNGIGINQMCMKRMHLILSIHRRTRWRSQSMCNKWLVQLPLACSYVTLFSLIRKGSIALLRTTHGEQKKEASARARCLYIFFLILMFFISFLFFNIVSSFGGFFIPSHFFSCIYQCNRNTWRAKQKLLKLWILMQWH